MQTLLSHLQLYNTCCASQNGITTNPAMIILYFSLTSYLPRARAVLGNIGPRSWQYRPSAAYKNDLGPILQSVRLELTWLVNNLLYGTQATLALNLPAFKNKKDTANDHFHGNTSYGEILTKKELIRMLEFVLP